MKKTLFVGLLCSISAFAQDFSLKIDNTQCHITSKKVIKTLTLGSNQDLVAQSSKDISINGLARYVEKMTQVSKEFSGQKIENFQFILTYKEKSYLIEPEDSDESATLTKMLSELCL